MKYIISAQIDDHKIIMSTVTEHGPGLDNIAAAVIRQVVDTQDQVIREALIKMGWTPPGG